MSGDFFERKAIKKTAHGKYDLKDTSDLKACGLNPGDESFQHRNVSLYKSLEKAANMELDANPVGYVAQQVEAHFSPREIAFLLAKTILVEAIKEDNKNNKSFKRETINGK